MRKQCLNQMDIINKLKVVCVLMNLHGIKKAIFKVGRVLLFMIDSCRTVFRSMLPSLGIYNINSVVNVIKACF